MNLHTAGNDVALGTFLHLAAAAAGIEVVAHDTIQDMTSALFRNPFALGALGITDDIAAIIVREIRLADVRNPLFVLTQDKGGPLSPRSVHTRVDCLLAGADDVQPHPLLTREYIARLMALERRDRGMMFPVVDFLNCHYYPARGCIEHEHGTICFTQREADAFSMLVERPHQVVSKEMLMQRLYNDRDEPQIKIVDVFICKIRKKIALATQGVGVIETAWGRGYAFIPEGFAPEVTTMLTVSRAVAS